MAITYVNIASITIGSGGASSASFTSIPQTYTDLLLKASLRSTRSAQEDGFAFSPNGAGATFWMLLSGDGSSTSGGSSSSLGYGSSFTGRIPAASATSNTFGNLELYLPNYSNTANPKGFSLDAATENDGTTAYISLESGYYSSTSAVSSITLQASNANLAQYSTFTLYGIKKN